MPQAWGQGIQGSVSNTGLCLPLLYKNLDVTLRETSAITDQNPVSAEGVTLSEVGSLQ